MLYQAYQASSDFSLPARALAGFALTAHNAVRRACPARPCAISRAAYELISPSRA